ncbi:MULTISPECIES: hypothetical protein [unclassified Microcoleus]|uniref:hypothetical protein n=1 Tax=unclassified Microcoleus TaxID=2642155 RepID=UPI002FD04740
METPHCLIGGITVNALPNNLYSTGSQQLSDYLYSYYNAAIARNFSVLKMLDLKALIFRKCRCKNMYLAVNNRAKNTL